jgi:hypothetical protein
MQSYGSANIILLQRNLEEAQEIEMKFLRFAASWMKRELAL